jgi:murein DD-endopeptidase MepM/ murein hydrolase activator NlpD
VVPVATAAAAADLSRLGALAFPAPAPLVLQDTSVRIRPVVRARSSVLTVPRPDPPALAVHVVAPDETLLSIAALYGVTPQTIAYNNNLSDTRDLRSGEVLVVPPLDAAIHVVRDGETVASIAAGFGVDAGAVRSVNSIAFEPEDVTPGRVLLLPVPDSRYPGFRLRVSDPPRVFAPRVRWPTDGVVTQLFTPVHSGIDIAAPYGSPVMASDSGTITEVGWRGPGGLAVCERLDWGLEICDYHLSATNVEVGDRVSVGQRIASVGSSGESTGPHVHWEARTNGVLVDPLTYAPEAAAVTRLGSRASTP